MLAKKFPTSEIGKTDAAGYSATLSRTRNRRGKRVERKLSDWSPDRPMGKIVGKTILDRVSGPRKPFRFRATLGTWIRSTSRRHMPNPLMDHSVLLVARLCASFLSLELVLLPKARRRLQNKNRHKNQTSSAIFRSSLAFFCPWLFA